MMSDDEQSLASRWLMFEASALVGASILERAPFKRAFDAGVLAALETLAVLMVKLPPVDPVLDGGKQMGCDRRLHDSDKQAEQADTQTGSKKGFLG